MKYKGIKTRSGHKIFVRNRSTAFDNNSTITKAKNSDFEDHKKAKTFEFAALQKKLFKQKRISKRKNGIILIASIVIAILFIFFLPTILKVIF